MGSDKAWEAAWLVPRMRGIVDDAPTYPGFHRDDWESFQTRLDPDGDVWVRASSHGHYQGCKSSRCRDRWVEGNGWTRVSRGSHAGHIPAEPPGHDLRERTTTAEGLRLIPLETHDKRGYRRLDDGIAPPWEKDAYRHHESGES